MTKTAVSKLARVRLQRARAREEARENASILSSVRSALDDAEWGGLAGAPTMQDAIRALGAKNRAMREALQQWALWYERTPADGDDDARARIRALELTRRALTMRGVAL